MSFRSYHNCRSHYRKTDTSCLKYSVELLQDKFKTVQQSFVLFHLLSSSAIRLKTIAYIFAELQIRRFT
ncbi:Glutamine--fructose-6-phosphate aminotransferase [Dirofilaria immitis]